MVGWKEEIIYCTCKCVPPFVSVGCVCFPLQYLPRNQHVVCVDMPGHEGTSRTGAEDYCIQGQVRRIHQVCTSESVETTSRLFVQHLK